MSLRQLCVFIFAIGIVIFSFFITIKKTQAVVVVGCNQTCQGSYVCNASAGQSCTAANVCRNTSCPAETNCVCPLDVGGKVTYCDTGASASGVTMSVYNNSWGPQTRTTTTDANGNWLISQMAHSGDFYAVRITPPPNYVQKTNEAGWNWDYCVNPIAGTNPWADTPLGSGSYECQRRTPRDCAGPNASPTQINRCSFCLQSTCQGPNYIDSPSADSTLVVGNTYPMWGWDYFCAGPNGSNPGRTDLYICDRGTSNNCISIQNPVSRMNRPDVVNFCSANNPANPNTAGWSYSWTVPPGAVGTNGLRTIRSRAINDYPTNSCVLSAEKNVTIVTPTAPPTPTPLQGFVQGRLIVGPTGTANPGANIPVNKGPTPYVPTSWSSYSTGLVYSVGNPWSATCTVPSPYICQYSQCSNCTSHPSYTTGNTVSGIIPTPAVGSGSPNGYVDLYWKIANPYTCGLLNLDPQAGFETGITPNGWSTWKKNGSATWNNSLAPTPTHQGYQSLKVIYTADPSTTQASTYLEKSTAPTSGQQAIFTGWIYIASNTLSNPGTLSAYVEHWNNWPSGNWIKGDFSNIDVAKVGIWQQFTVISPYKDAAENNIVISFYPSGSAGAITFYIDQLCLTYAVVPTPTLYPTAVITGSINEYTGDCTPGISVINPPPLTLGLQPRTSSNGVTTLCTVNSPASNIYDAYRCTIVVNNQVGALTPTPVASQKYRLLHSTTGYNSVYFATSCSAYYPGLEDIQVDVSAANPTPPVQNNGNINILAELANVSWFKLKDTSFNLRELTGRQDSIPRIIKAYDTEDDKSHTVLSGNSGLLVQDGALNPGPNAYVAGVLTYSTKNWYTSSYSHTNDITYLKYIDYMKARKDFTTITDLSKITTDGIYIISSSVTIPARQFDNKKVVLVVQGTATIDADFIPNNGSVALLANTIEIKSTVTEVDAILIGQTVTTNLSTGGDTPSAIGLKIKGNLIDEGSTFELTRTQANAHMPSLFVVFDPHIYLNVLPYLSTSTYDWRQIQ